MERSSAKGQEGVKVHWTAPPWSWRWPRRRIHDAPLLLALLVWLCALPVILLLTIPFFGPTVGLSAAAAALIAILLVCLGICSSASENEPASNQPRRS